MKKIITYLQGKKTNIIAFAAIVYSAGVDQHLWASNQFVYAMLAALGGVALRAGVAKATKE